MEAVPTVLLTVLALAGILLATVACVVVLVAAVVIVAIVAMRQRKNAAPLVEPAA